MSSFNKSTIITTAIAIASFETFLIASQIIGFGAILALNSIAIFVLFYKKATPDLNTIQANNKKLISIDVTPKQITATPGTALAVRNNK